MRSALCFPTIDAAWEAVKATEAALDRLAEIAAGSKPSQQEGAR